MTRALLPVAWRIFPFAVVVSILPPATAHAAVDAYATVDRQAPAQPGYDVCEDVRASAGVDAVAEGRGPPPQRTLTALERVSAMQQGGAAESVGAALPAANAGVTRASIAAAFAAERPSDPVPAPSAGCATPPAGLGPGQGRWRPRATDAAIDPNSELGTIAIPIARTPFDVRWKRASRTPPAALMRAELRRAGVTGPMGQAEIAQRVNQWVNHRVRYVEDQRNYRENDVWATAEQTAASGRGDCEDFAILKMQMLLAAGVDADSVKLVLLRDLAVNADHALLLVSTDAGKLVLDNMTDRVYDGSRANDFRPVLSFSGARRWVHGYADVQSEQIAATTPTLKEAAIPAIPAATDQPARPIQSLAAAYGPGPIGSGFRSFRLSSVRYRTILFGRHPIFDGM